MTANSHGRTDLSKRGDSKRGDFFQIDLRIWPVVCDLSMNAAVAYLVLARFSSGDNATTKASVNAVETYTGISRGRARKAIDSLIQAGIVRRDAGGANPKYCLLPAEKVRGTGVKEKSARKPMTIKQQPVYELVKNGLQPEGLDRQQAHGLTYKGWLTKDNNSDFHICDETVKRETNWIWLPNELVSGAAGEKPAIELVRQTQDVMTLRLLVDFYNAQNLREDGGISRIFTYQIYERKKVGQQAQYVIWGFRYQSGCVRWEGPTFCHRRENLTDQEIDEGKNAGVDFFRREQQLSDLGLIEWVPYLFDGDGDDAEPIHPYGIDMGDTMEGRLCRAADEAGRALITDRQREWANENDLWLAPVPCHMGNVQMFGVARLRYRAKTNLTAAWWGELQTKGERYIQRYAEITARKSQRAAGF